MLRHLLVILSFASLLSTPVLGQMMPIPVAETIPEITLEVPAQRLNASLDFLYFYMTDLRVPPLVTTGPTGSQAIFGQPATQVLRGDGRLPTRHTRYIGVRGNLDWWFTDDSPFGVDLSVTIMERNSSNLTYQWHDINPLARPYQDDNDGQWKSEIVAGNHPI